MPILFSNILIPVDFSVNTDLAIAKALSISESEPMSLHLFHAQRIVLPGVWPAVQYLVSGYSRRQVNSDRIRIMDQLNEIKKKIHQTHPELKIHCSVGFGDPIEEAILKRASRLKCDLIIIGKKTKRRLPWMKAVTPSRLALRSGCPVLTAASTTVRSDIKTIVIPISNKSPDRKLSVLEALRKKMKLQVRLVTFKQDEKNGLMARHSLFKAIRRLKNQHTIPVDFEELPGNNKARSLLKYCNRVGADVLIAHPESETCISSWTNSHISDQLPKESNMSVLSVA